MTVRTRFAPSPTGHIHIGNVYQILFDYAYAQKNRGQFILRIEDTDKKRFVQGAEEVIYRGLVWLGIKPSEGPQEGGPFSPYHQSQRLDIYRKHAEELVGKSKAYYCFCSPERLEKIRKEKQAKRQPPMYDGKCRGLDPEKALERVQKGENHVIRMKIPEKQTIIVNDLIRGQVKFNSQTVDDQVLIKSDGFPTYHLAATVDDHLMKISHVIRGEEWLSSAPKHVLLYQYFGWQPPVFFHTPIIRNPDKSKMSKRQGHAFLSWYQEQGFLPEALLNYLALLGWSHPEEKDAFSLEEFIKLFELKDVSPLGPVFDLRKLEWLNGVYLRKKSNRELAKLLKGFKPKGMKKEMLNKIIPLVKERMLKLADFQGLTDFFVNEPAVDAKLMVKKGGADKKLLKEQLSVGLNQLEKVKNWRSKDLEKEYRRLADGHGWHIGKFFMATRMAVTGKTVTPPLFETMEALGRKKTLSRLKSASAAF